MDESYYLQFFAVLKRFPHMHALTLRSWAIDSSWHKESIAQLLSQFMGNAFAFAETRRTPPTTPADTDDNEHPRRTVIHISQFELRVNAHFLFIFYFFTLGRGDGNLLSDGFRTPSCMSGQGRCTLRRTRPTALIAAVARFTTSNDKHLHRLCQRDV